MDHANFIAMDTEHYDGQNFSSVGLAFASNLEPSGHPCNPAAMTGALEKRDLVTQNIDGASRNVAMAQSICFNIRGFERAHPTRERIWDPPDNDIHIEAVASKVTDFVRQCKELAPERPLILVTYSAQAELSAISTLFPELFLLFSNWVDLQPLVLEAYHRHTNYTRLNGLCISLKNAMRIFSFSAGYQPKHLHHAGNDALRTLAVMKCLTYENVQCRRSEQLENILRVKELQKEQIYLKGTAKDRGLKSNRPGPPSQYPHVAKITMVPHTDIAEQSRTGHQFAVAAEEQEDDGQLHLPPADVNRPHQVWDFFSPYEPNAIGRVCKESCYYVCVSNETILAQLFCDLDRTLVCQGTYKLLVEDVSDVHALGAAKREERAKSREALDEKHWLTYLL